MNSTSPAQGGGPAVDPAADPRPVFELAARQMASLFDAVRPAQLADPTPCPGFSVGALLSHVVGGTLRVAQVGEGGGPGEVDPDAEVDSGVSGVADDAWPAAYERARERFRAAWADDAKLDAVVTVPWGTMPGRFALAGSVMEVVTHAWDLAQALGRRAELDVGPAEFALAVAKRAVPAETRGGEVPFGPPVRAPEGADAYDELAAWLGRSWTPAGSAGGSNG
ncbi:TIGR03086 family protein [Streptomyces sp. WMMB 714]|uniref:TIGR03086 family metal-binding protein n=1 Tax=Streptomyces sp. WMMB 714 TaxID=1286822 RepID=UPI0005F83640|nr:TIGR03086 family metal-binding protein [Streptomyces sp. WMMB 714]SCK21797.1 TIGR03086 family protein [Streptomyces sp. WMMB 714]